MVEMQRELQALQPVFPHIGILVLQELRDLEKRPERSIAPWAESMRARYTSKPGHLALVLPLQPVIAERNHLENLSREERVVRGGGVQRLLIRLAITGRIDEQEFNSFVRRLRGN